MEVNWKSLFYICSPEIKLKTQTIWKDLIAGGKRDVSERPNFRVKQLY